MENTAIHVRLARLDDTQAISALFRARISVWQRINADGQVEDVPYESLTLYERWLHGGAWLSVETGAVFLSHLLRGFALPLVAVVGGRLAAYVEAYPGSEPAPVGDHLHLGALVVPGQDAALMHALLAALGEYARQNRCAALTASLSAYDAETRAFYEAFGFQQRLSVRRYHVAAVTGQSFYKAAEHRSTDPAQIDGWAQPIGRVESARQHWSTLWPRLWESVDEIAARRTYRLRFTAAGQESFVYCQPDLYEPRRAEIYCWSPKPLTPQYFISLRDWAHREHFRTLALTLPDDMAKMLGTDAEPTPYQHTLLALAV